IQDKVERERLQKEVEIAHNTLKFKQNFLASMSHEMRTPLTAIVGITELLKNTPLEKKQYEYINTLMQSADNLKSVIDQVLDYSNLEAGKVQLKAENYSIRKLVDNSNEYYKTICLKPIVLNVSIDDQLEDMLHFDHRRIFQVIKNLILNAVMFTPKGTIELKVEKTKELDNGKIQVKIIVSDTGIGIENEKQQLLFSPFSQVQHIDTERYKGIGLGLSICKEIVELHQGDIGLTSKPAKGTTVWFTFAAQKTDIYDNKNEHDQKYSSNHAHNLHILLVEDKSVTQKVISLMLKDMGHRVILASHGKEALEVFPQYYFDMILMDIQMPVMDGITATQQLKEHYADLPPVVGLSANAFEGDRKKYMKLGLDEYLTKPVRKEDFQRIIEKMLQPKIGG
ncbi:MAG: ATP-binding protein, partial [Bacteroidota bacterium]